ncbi:MAG: hypothetical protein IPG53_05085 [Ignavibacteriales bacterium]|nr:hypothetical protein [Ignavibacteriales bacterium]
MFTLCSVSNKNILSFDLNSLFTLSPKNLDCLIFVSIAAIIVFRKVLLKLPDAATIVLIVFRLKYGSSFRYIKTGTSKDSPLITACLIRSFAARKDSKKTFSGSVFESVQAVSSNNLFDYFRVVRSKQGLECLSLFCCQVDDCL